MPDLLRVSTQRTSVNKCQTPLGYRKPGEFQGSPNSDINTPD